MLDMNHWFRVAVSQLGPIGGKVGRDPREPIALEGCLTGQMELAAGVQG